MGMIFFGDRYAFLVWGSEGLEMGNDPIHPEDRSVSPPSMFLGLKSQQLGAVQLGGSCLGSEQPCPKHLPAVLLVFLPFVGN